MVVHSSIDLLHQSLCQPHERGFQVHRLLLEMRYAEAVVDQHIRDIREVAAVAIVVVGVDDLPRPPPTPNH